MLTHKLTKNVTFLDKIWNFGIVCLGREKGKETFTLFQRLERLWWHTIFWVWKAQDFWAFSKKVFHSSKGQTGGMNNNETISKLGHPTFQFQYKVAEEIATFSMLSFRNVRKWHWKVFFLSFLFFLCYLTTKDGPKIEGIWSWRDLISWRDFIQKGFFPEGILSWRDLILKGFEDLRDLISWRDLIL